MKLNDLKQGMVCTLRSGEIMTVIGPNHYVRNSISKLDERYIEDLTHKQQRELDIMEITYGDKVVFTRNESRWFVPEDGERYYFLHSYGEIVLMTNVRSGVDYEVFDNCKVFKTKEEAEKRLRQQQATLSVERWIAENDVEVEVFNKELRRYFVAYDNERKKLDYVATQGYVYLPKRFTLSSREKAEQLINEREKELKLMFGVEE